MDTNRVMDSFVDNRVTQNFYLEYLKKININQLNWNYEEDSNEVPTLTFKQDNIKKLKEYMAGSYEAELLFSISYNTSENDRRDFMTIVAPLIELNDIFRLEKSEDFPNLYLDNGRAIDITMTSVPKKDKETNNEVVKYTATYKLQYKMRGRY